MKTENLLLIAALGVGAYFLLNNNSVKAANLNDSGLVGVNDGTNKITYVPQATTTIYGETKPVYTEVFVTSGSSKGTGKTQTLAVPAYTGKSSYDTISGTGYNAAGYGYSSNKDLGVYGTGTGVNSVLKAFSSKPYGL